MEFKVQKEVLDSGVKRRKNIPASENLIKLLVKHGDMFYINRAVDIYNNISLESKLALGAHNMDKTEGDVTLRFTDGTENMFRWVSLSLWRWLSMNTATAMIPSRCFADWNFVR